MRRILCFLAFAGCSSGFPPYSDIHSLSVLAIVAEPPEVTLSGSATSLQAEVFDPAGRCFSDRPDVPGKIPFEIDRVVDHRLRERLEGHAA